MAYDPNGILPLSENYVDRVHSDDEILAPDAKTIPSQLEGSVFIDGKTSYSGADIKAIAHIYDGGKLANQRRQELQDDISFLQEKTKALEGQIQAINKRVATGQYTSSDVNLVDKLNRELMITENTITALFDEETRLNKLKPKYSTKVLAELQTISVSTHRVKVPVRSLSTAYPKGFVRGTRTIAGSMIFTVFDTNVLDEFLETHPSDYDAHNPTTSALLDQIPPFDITIAFANELGQVSRMTIYGIEFVNEGQTMSIEDMLLENVVQYVARDIDPMRVVSTRKIDENNRLSSEIVAMKASSLLEEEDYQQYKEMVSPFSRFKNRTNPFI